MMTIRLVRFTAMLLMAVLMHYNLAFAANKRADPAAVKVKVRQRGVGRGVRVTLTDNTDAKGLIVSMGEESFMLKPKDADQPREIEYAQVTGVHNDRMTAGQKVGIGVAIAGTAIVITAVVIKSTIRIW